MHRRWLSGAAVATGWPEFQVEAARGQGPASGHGKYGWNSKVWTEKRRHRKPSQPSKPQRSAGRGANIRARRSAHGRGDNPTHEPDAHPTRTPGRWAPGGLETLRDRTQPVRGRAGDTGLAATLTGSRRPPPPRCPRNGRLVPRGFRGRDGVCPRQTGRGPRNQTRELSRTSGETKPPEAKLRARKGKQSVSTRGTQRGPPARAPRPGRPPSATGPRGEGERTREGSGRPAAHGRSGAGGGGRQVQPGSRRGAPRP